MKKRNKIEIVYDILEVIRINNSHIKTTQILSKANLSHVKLKVFLEELEGNGLIEIHEEKKHKYYQLSKKGYEYLDKLKQMKKFMEVFEI